MMKSLKWLDMEEIVYRNGNQMSFWIITECGGKNHSINCKYNARNLFVKPKDDVL